MARDQFKRKLTTIFSADVAGYSRLMGENEAATVRTLEQYKQIMSELIRQHRGRVVDSPGDNLLAEFTSVVDAVQCAVATQKELQARNEELTENRKMHFRIGVNLGDVIEEELLAAAGGALPDMVWLYFALSQFPIYLSPQILKPLAKRLLKPSIDSRCNLA